MGPVTRYPGSSVATRSIVTSQPDVACDVCMRRLLRGERPDIFLAGGRRLTVCELCAPRAVHEGWLRERDAQAVNLAPPRPRRGRGLFARLRGRVEPAGPGAGLESPVAPAQMAAEGLQPVDLEALALREFVEPGPAESGPNGSGRDGSEPAAFGPVTPGSVEFDHMRLDEDGDEAAVAAGLAGGIAVAAELSDDAPVEAERAEDGFHADEPAGEGSWRDAWMFVTE
jgi:hypothetical protein